MLLQQLDAGVPLIKKTSKLSWGFLDDGSVNPPLRHRQCLFKIKRLVLISKATDIVSVNMSNDLLVVKDVTVALSAAPRVVIRDGLNLGQHGGPGSGTAWGCDLSYINAEYTT